MDYPVESYHEFLTQMETCQYSDGIVDVSHSSQSSPHSGHSGSSGARPSTHSDNTASAAAASTSPPPDVRHFQGSILAHNHFLHPITYTDKASGLIYQRLQHPPAPESANSLQPPLFPQPAPCCAVGGPSSAPTFCDLPSYDYDEDDDYDDDDNEFFGSHDLMFNNSNDSICLTNDGSSSNPVVPGLFPQMHIDDDAQFMKFDALPLTPSYVSR